MKTVTKASSRFVLLLGLAGAIVVSSSAGCSVGLNTSAVQCLSEAECLAKGPAFVNTTCDPVTKTCVPVDVNAGLCATNEDCITANAGSASMCRKSDHKCVLLASNDCPFVRGTPAEIANDNTIFIGALTPVSNDQPGNEVEAALVLAQSDLSALGGLPPTAGSNATRPVVIVSCRVGAGHLLGATQHLVEDVRVPLIIGPMSSADAAETMTEYALPNQVLSILPGANVSSLSDLPNPVAPTPLVWRLAPSQDIQVAGIQSFINTDLCGPDGQGGQGCDAASRVVTLGIVPANTPIKIMFIGEGDLAGLDYLHQYQTQLTFNCSYFSPCGTSDNSAPNPPSGWTGSWPEFGVGNLGNANDPVNDPNPAAVDAQVVAAALKFQPNVIVWGVNPPSIQPAFLPIEQQWATANPGIPRPIHIIQDINAPRLGGIIATPLGTTSNMRHRVFFFGAKLPQTSIVGDFTAHYQQANSGFTGQIPSTVFYENDAAYVAIYGMAAVGSAPMTGPNIGAALAKGKINPPGKSIDALPLDLPVGLSTLTSGSNIDLNGVTGSLDFDLKKGAITNDVAIECFNSSMTLVDSGFDWSYSTGQPTGTVANCN
jgi:hypothetical protein